MSTIGKDAHFSRGSVRETEFSSTDTRDHGEHSTVGVPYISNRSSKQAELFSWKWYHSAKFRNYQHFVCHTTTLLFGNVELEHISDHKIIYLL